MIALAERAPTAAPAPAAPPSGIGARVLTALLLGIVILAAVIWGRQYGLAVVIAVIAGFATAEFYALSRRERRKPNELFGVVAAMAMPVVAAWQPQPGLLLVVIGLAVAALLWHLTFRQVTASDTAMTVFGAIYVGLLLSHLVLLQRMPQGAVFVVITLVSVWADDIFAYFVGIGVGRHKLAPRISPHKSWEGFFAGLVSSELVWLAAYSLVRTGLPVWMHAVLGVVVPVAGLIGDLVESRFKREAGKKDSGTLLPGHGGFLDRFDSLILVSAVVYYVVYFYFVLVAPRPIL